MYVKNSIDADKFKPLLADYLVNKKGITNLREHFKCLNPDHEDKHPSMMFTSKYNICKCFSCGASYDIFDLIGIDYDVTSFRDKLSIASNLYPNVDVDISKFLNSNENNSNNEIIDFSYYYKKCKKDISKTDYLLKRNISLDLIKKYNIGYDVKKDMIIFPINKNCYFGRGVNQNIKFKSKGISYLWNENLLKNSNNKLIYVTESIIDSLSLEMIDPNVLTIALNGLPNYKRLLKLIQDYNYDGYFVLAFDNDKTGTYYQNIVKEELANLNITSFATTLISNMNDVKDINEALIKDKFKLENNYKYFNKNFENYIEKNRGSEINL